MKTITVSLDTFTEIILGLIQSGVTFEAIEVNGQIEIEFTGGF
jgi:hypothetical protein